jgi:hypothetical protein
MDSMIIKQLAELAAACQRKDIKPIICGGLGIYLSYFRKEDGISKMIRATQDIDLMLSREDLLEQAKRNAIAEIITKELNYIVQDNKQHHGFKKDGIQELDILVPPNIDLPASEHRLKIVKSNLHGYITREAEFIEEDLRAVQLSSISDEYAENDAKLYIPSPINLIIMKLFAFNDRSQGKRFTSDRAMAHAWDLFIAIMLTDREDLKQGQAFLARHSDSELIQKAREIVQQGFSEYEQIGWQTVLSSRNFYPKLDMAGREQKLKDAAIRMRRWFISE